MNAAPHNAMYIFPRHKFTEGVNRFMKIPHNKIPHNAKEGLVAVAAVIAFMSLVWFVVWKENGAMETLYYVSQLLTAISAAGIAVTLFIFYHKPAIKELLRGDFWISSAFVVSFALVGLQNVISTVVPIQDANTGNVAVSCILSSWLTLKWLFITRRLIQFGNSPTVAEATEARAIMEEVSEEV